MSNQIFKKSLPVDILFELLDQICLKTEKYYLIDLNAFKKMVFLKLNEPFLTLLSEYYHSSKQFYLTREFTYNSFTNIIRQICKNNAIMFTSNIKYNESKYNIDYFIYFYTLEDL
jgi:hypothetical protein